MENGEMGLEVVEGERSPARVDAHDGDDGVDNVDCANLLDPCS